MNRLSRVETWVYGLISGTIGGSASAGGAWLGMNVAKASGVDVPSLNLKALAVIMASAGLVNALSYLSKSPLPALPTGNTEIVPNPNQILK